MSLMKYISENIDEITDSREIMQSYPNGITRIVTYLIIAFLSIFLIWSLIAVKQVSITATGVVRPKNEVVNVSSGLQGSITKIYIKDGDEVKKGDTLFSIDAEEYEIQRKKLQQSLDNNTKSLELLKKLKDSVLENENKFCEDNFEEYEYYQKYKIYEKNLNLSAKQKESMESNSALLKEKVSNLKSLKRAIENEENTFIEGSSNYYKYNQYILQRNKYKKEIDSNEKKINELKNSINDQNKEIDALKDKNKEYELEMEIIMNTAISNINSEIEQYELSSNIDGLNTDSGNLYKESYLSNIEDSIKNVGTKIEEININLEILNLQIEKSIIKASCDGRINMVQNVATGSYVQSGSLIATILPCDKTQFNVEIYINNHEIGNIKNGQDVVIELISLPSVQYGYIHSKLDNLSIDTKVNQESGISYYTAESSINKNGLTDKHGNFVDIKNGMIAEVKIINRKVSYFIYFLEKVNILK